jgi:hypothetical protein
MATSSLGREQIINALHERLEPLDFILAMWEGGAAAFNRIDEWSDIDLQVAAHDDRTAEVFPAIESVLLSLSPIELKYEIPQPAWHGHAQTFYRLSRASKYLLIDLVVIKRSSPLKFLEPEIHGNAVVHFDKANIIRAEPLDRSALNSKLIDRVSALRVTFDLFQILTLKELERHNDIEALAFYQSFTLRPLTEALRIRYAPARYNFHTRYVQYDLPPDVVQQLQALFFVKDVGDLGAKREQAELWFHRTLDEIHIDRSA